MTEKEKMLQGKIYDTSDETLMRMRLSAHKLSKDYNDTYEDEVEKRTDILKKLLPDMGKDTYIQGPVQFDYGVNTSFGERCLVNFNFVVLDCCPVTIGDDVFIGPNCTLATPVHPLLAEERRLKYKENGTPFDYEYAKPIVIRDGCWIATNVTVCGGVTIGKNCVIGAGSVVTRDIPDGTFAAGDPCVVIRKITKEDSIKLKKELF